MVGVVVGDTLLGGMEEGGKLVVVVLMSVVVLGADGDVETVVVLEVVLVEVTTV